MTIPGFQELMLPILKELATRGETRTTELVNVMADRFDLSLEERAEMLPSGKQAVIANRTHWAIAYLTKTGLIQRPRRAHYMIDERGRKALDEEPARIDLKFLSQFPELAVFRGEAVDAPPNVPVPADATPDEIIARAHKQIEAVLRNDVLDRILLREPAFFEALVMKFLVAMGYGGGNDSTVEVIGGAGDEGGDVVVRQDPLGLDRVYVQAKRYSRDRG